MKNTPNIPKELLTNIKEHFSQWNLDLNSKYSRTFKKKDKGKIIAEVVKKYFSISLDKRVDLELILNELNMEIEIAELNDFNKNNPNSFKSVWGVWKERTIYISKHLETERAKNFTLAHELGHVFMDFDKDEDVFYRIRQISNNNEIIINDFAANLLIPCVDENFLKEFKQKSTFELAKKYNVPFDTISILAERLEYEKNGKY